VITATSLFVFFPFSSFCCLFFFLLKFRPYYNFDFLWTDSGLLEWFIFDSESENLFTEVMCEAFIIYWQGRYVLHIVPRSLKSSWNILCTFLFSCFRRIANSDYLASSYLFVYLVAWIKFSSHWKNFHEILYLTFFRKSVGKIEVSLNDLYSVPNIVRVVKSRRMRWAGHVARMG
jgi:hypothetical protein